MVVFNRSLKEPVEEKKRIFRKIKLFKDKHYTLAMAKKLTVRHLERCVGCLNCVMACARERFNKLSIDQAAIAVKAAGQTAYYSIIVCRGCQDPVCLRACPTGALRKRPGGGVILNKAKCDACGLCKDACILGAIKLDQITGMPIICIHCGQCVDFCPHGILVMEEVED
ncbi:MAG: (Fe-S)-binding protein [Candidatus Gerdarchaeota archaeon]|nr:MAG: (Fe-S)-binding protein [Candidatus Gerdarchaeota archaeon]